MTIRMPFWQRAALVLVPFTAAAIYAYHYVISHDLERWLRRATAGKQVSWPPSPKPNAGGGTDDDADLPLADTVLDVAPLGGFATLAVALALLAGRAVHRATTGPRAGHRELRLGRDDLSNPYRVQEAFEGIVGAIWVRWYRRLWAGHDHFALEIHRLPDRSIRFTVAARRACSPAIAGPLEDLYPDVRLIDPPARPPGRPPPSPG